MSNESFKAHETFAGFDSTVMYPHPIQDVDTPHGMQINPRLNSNIRMADTAIRGLLTHGHALDIDDLLQIFNDVGASPSSARYMPTDIDLGRLSIRYEMPIRIVTVGKRKFYVDGTVPPDDTDLLERA